MLRHYKENAALASGNFRLRIFRSLE